MTRGEMRAAIASRLGAVDDISDEIQRKSAIRDLLSFASSLEGESERNLFADLICEGLINEERFRYAIDKKLPKTRKAWDPDW